MHYETAFEALTWPYRYSWFVVTIPVLVYVGVILAIRRKWLAERQSGPTSKRMGLNLFPTLVLILVMAGSILAAIAATSDFISAGRALETGDCQIVEGRVENFHPMPANGHENEQFSVNGVNFSYSDNNLTAGFGKTLSHGGPIRADLPVRICHKGNEILRLEVAR